MLVGVNLVSFDIGEIEEGDFFVKFKLRNKEDGFQWVLVSVYGAAQQQYKSAFLSELVQLCGDFNIIRCRKEKNNANYCDRWPFLFNAVIEAGSVMYKLGTQISSYYCSGLISGDLRPHSFAVEHRRVHFV
ncbi:hypothetical protein U9M48_032792 [Paspalum notatum var. saurae]|uniref:Uncharacterized protein n=1 Tax=Paspalum notatum var. saurae TaxID=547442 RepID=A0AAQ3U5X2_PASNO